MKRWAAVALAVVLAVGVSAAGLAEAAKASYLFCYVIDVGPGSFQVLTDGEVAMTFERGEGMSVASQACALAVDDVVMVQYEGSLNYDAEAQTATVGAVTVLSTLYGSVEAIGGDGSLSVRTLSDDGSEGALYAFDGESADIAVGEGGVMVGDDVEVAYAGDASMLVAGGMQGLQYVHITVFGQVEDQFE